jgi:parallel beta-helix repeat protein
MNKPYLAGGRGRVAAVVALSTSLALLSACGGDSSSRRGGGGPTFPADAIFLDAEDLTTSAKEALINIESGDVIVFPDGEFAIEDTLSLINATGVSNVTLRGYGRERTVLDFSDSSGGDGIYIEGVSNVTIRDLTVIEAANNAIKLKGVDGIHIHHTGTEWRGELNEENGAYGLYPVESSNILIEHSYVRGSADAGIYVGQSQNIVVRHNEAVENVAGIEIENSTNADVYNNVARGNTGGVLIFDLPIGNGIYGSTVRVFNNEVFSNNTDNFANQSSNPAGVHIVPPGTGVIVLATRDVEIYNNLIDDHDGSAVIVSSYMIASQTPEPAIADGFRSVPRNVSVHDNNIGSFANDPRGELMEDVILAFSMFGGIPAILYDGLGEAIANDATLGPVFSEAPFANDGSDNVCAQNNGAVSVGYLYSPGMAFNPATLDPMPGKGVGNNSLINCSQPRLPAASATINGVEYGCGIDDNSEACAL